METEEKVEKVQEMSPVATTSALSGVTFNKILILVIVVTVAVIVVAIATMDFTRRRSNVVSVSRVSTETIITDIREAAEMIVAEIGLEHTIINEQRGGFLWIGTRAQQMTFVGTGIMTTNLSGFRDDNIIVDSYARRVMVAVPRPQLYTVAIDPGNSRVYETEHSFFSWGENTFNAEEQMETLQHTQDAMELLLLRERMAEVYTYGENAIANFVRPILNAAGMEGYTIHVTWQ